MATILIVDDQPTNREYLVALLGYQGHRLLQAADGAEGLAVARAELPDLVVADILMPTMDGYEFVRQLRADPAIASVPVIFYTAHYYEQEAQALAHACGIFHVLTKPCEPEVVLRTVETALHVASIPAPPLPEEFARDHLHLLTNKLSQKADELRRVNERLTPLIDLGLDLGLERDPTRLLQSFCHRIREVIGARYAVVGMLDSDGLRLRHCITSGMDSATAARLGSPDPKQGVLGTVLNERRCCRLGNPGGDPENLGFSRFFPNFCSVLAAPIVSPARVYGWLCLLDKLGAEEFSREDEHLAGIVAAQVGRIYENGSLYTDVLRHAADLEREAGERKRAERALQESHNLLRAVIESIPEIIYVKDHQGRYVVVNSETARFVGKPAEEILGRDDVALFEPDTAKEFMNADRRVIDTGKAETYEKAGTAALANHTYLTTKIPFWGPDGEVRGVLGISRDISERKRAEEALRATQEFLSRLLENAPTAIHVTSPEGRRLLVNRAWEELCGMRREEAIGRELEAIFPPETARAFLAENQKILQSGAPQVFEAVLDTADGRRFLHTVKFPLRDAAGGIEAVTGVTVDITDRKRAEQTLQENADRLQALSRRLVEVQEEERHHLARELHDEIGQLLATINFHLHAAKGLAGAAALAQLEECATLLQQAGERVRSLALELRPTMLDTLGLEAALRWLAERHQQRTGCEVQIIGHLSGAPPSAELAIACFRVAQEALTNVVRHAAARNVWIELRQSDSALELVVRDDGVGFDVASTQEQASRRGHLGLLGMAERVQLLGGSLDVESEPGRGTRIRASFPMSEGPEDPAETEE